MCSYCVPVVRPFIYIKREVTVGPRTLLLCPSKVVSPTSCAFKFKVNFEVFGLEPMASMGFGFPVRVSPASYEPAYILLIYNPPAMGQVD